MKHPRFLETDELLEIHADQIRRYGGTEGVRDMGLLLSAAAMPVAGVGKKFLHEDLFEMAAAYLFHLAQNHPFLDGNKRTAVAAASVFLRLNGERWEPKDLDAFESLVRRVASGVARKSEVSDYFHQQSSGGR